MTRAVTTQFAAATLPSLPALDADLLGLANLAVVACTATGTNAVVLTPVAATLTVSAYSDKELYSFNAPATSTGVMTVQVSSGAALKLFKPGGTIQATTGDVTSAQFYLIAYQTALDTGAGGFIIVSALSRQPTRSVLSSGTAQTYTTKDGCTRINVRMVGGGGGGAGSGTTPGAAGAGGNTTFGTALLVANGGALGSTTTSATGGAATGGDINLTGAAGQAASTAISSPGGNGGASPFGGAGAGGVVGNTTGLGATGNTGSGGGGAADGANANSGGGGAAGGYIEKLIVAPNATYTYTVGIAGTAGTAGTGGVGGGAGGSGLIIVDEFYN